MNEFAPHAGEQGPDYETKLDELFELTELRALEAITLHSSQSHTLYVLTDFDTDTFEPLLRFAMTDGYEKLVRANKGTYMEVVLPGVLRENYSPQFFIDKRETERHFSVTVRHENGHEETIKVTQSNASSSVGNGGSEAPSERLVDELLYKMGTYQVIRIR